MKTRHWILFVAAFAAVGSLLMQNNTRAASRLLPFQGRFTDAQGNLIADGARVIQFKIFDAPVGGQAVWNGEVQKLTVNGGLVSTLLGTKANLSSVNFDRELYLELTVDANNDGQITAADPPLLPRQSILPAVFAVEAADSRKLAGENWTPLFGTNNPAGHLLDSKIRDASIVGTKIVPHTIHAGLLTSNTVTAGQIAPGTISSNEIAPGTITEANLSAALRQLIRLTTPPGTIVPFGGINPPPGWFLCDGRELLRSEYPDLFVAIGTAWGSDDASQFNIPDLRGVFLRGVDGGSGQDPDRGSRYRRFTGANSGNNVGSYQDDQNRAHAHALFIDQNGDVDAWGIAAAGKAQIEGPHSRGTVESGGSESRPKNAAVNYIIKY